MRKVVYLCIGALLLYGCSQAAQQTDPKSEKETVSVQTDIQAAVKKLISTDYQYKITVSYGNGVTLAGIGIKQAEPYMQYEVLEGEETFVFEEDGERRRMIRDGGEWFPLEPVDPSFPCYEKASDRWKYAGIETMAAQDYKVYSAQFDEAAVGSGPDGTIEIMSNILLSYYVNQKTGTIDRIIMDRSDFGNKAWIVNQMLQGESGENAADHLEENPELSAEYQSIVTYDFQKIDGTVDFPDKRAGVTD